MISFDTSRLPTSNHFNLIHFITHFDYLNNLKNADLRNLKLGNIFIYFYFFLCDRLFLKFYNNKNNAKITSFGEVSRRIVIRIHRPAVPRETVSLPVVIVGLESRVDHAVGGETGAFLGHPLRRRRRRVSTLVPTPAVSVPLASPLLPRETIGLRFRSRALRRETLVLRREGRVHRMHSIVEMWI